MSRKTSIEWLRIISMFFIVASHSVVHGEFGVFPITKNGLFALALTQGGRIGVNLFICISGYFSIEKVYSSRKALILYQQIWFYSVIIFISMLFLGQTSLSFRNAIFGFLPLSSELYWFATSYFLLMLISPILNLFILHSDSKIYRAILLTFFLLWSVLPQLHIASPCYSKFSWLVFIYLLAAYLRKYPFVFEKRIRIWHGAVCFVFIITACLLTYFVGQNIPFFYSNAQFLYSEMNMIPAILCSFLFFFGFINWNSRQNIIVNKIASCTFGVYLFHDNPYIRDILWNKVFHVSSHIDDSFFPIRQITVIIIVFLFGIIIEITRKYLFKLLMKINKVSQRTVKNVLWNHNRRKHNKYLQSKLNTQAKTASILSMNCIGGILSHDLGLRFLSPTVNLFFRAEDFIKFCEKLDYYLSIEKFVECRDPAIIGQRSYPIAFLGDLTLFLVHYRSVAEAQEKWNERKKRINRDNIVLLNTDREGMTEALKDRFEALPYRKVMFTHLPDEVHKSCFCIRGYEKEPCVGIITDHDSWDGTRPIDQFDYVSFLNGCIDCK